MHPLPASERRLKNHLLAMLPAAAFDRIALQLRRVTLRSKEILHRAGEDIHHVYFPLDCLISITVTMRDGRTAETGLVGQHGLVGINGFMSGRATTQTEYVVQIEGAAMRLPVRPFREQFGQDEAFRSVLLRYTQAMFAQVTQNAACNALHGLEKRLARWLLEASECIGSADLRLTHQFMSEMLGVRRASVSELAGTLERRGLIARERSSTRVLDREGLEETACECYSVMRDQYNRLLGDPKGTTV